MEDATKIYHPAQELADWNLKENSLDLRFSAEYFIADLKIERGHLLNKNLNGKHFVCCDFQNLQIFNSVFESCNFSDVLVKSSELKGVLFKNCSFIRTQFYNNTSGALVFENCYFENANIPVEEATQKNLYFHVIPEVLSNKKARDTDKNEVLDPKNSGQVAKITASKSSRFGQLDLERVNDDKE